MPRIVVEEKLNKWHPVINSFRPEVSTIIRKATFDTYNHSQITVPVRRPDVVARTGILGGFLKNSGQPVVSPGAVEGEVRYTAYYAGYVHEGTYKMPARPFLRDAFEAVKPSMMAAFRQLESRLG